MRAGGWWWGTPRATSLLAIKRVPLLRASIVKLDMTAPKSLGTQDFTLFFMCDSYMGCDQVRLRALTLSSTQ